MRLHTLVVVCSLALLTAALNYTQYVDLFIGTQGSIPGTSYNGGNVFPGASLPFGAVKVGIDTTEYVYATEILRRDSSLEGSTNQATLMQATPPMATLQPSPCFLSLALAAPQNTE